MRLVGLFAFGILACNTSQADQKVAPSSRGSAPTCEDAGAKLNELSAVEAKAIGRTWSEDKARKKLAEFIPRCEQGREAGSTSDAALKCVMDATTVASGQACLAPP